MGHRSTGRLVAVCDGLEDEARPNGFGGTERPAEREEHFQEMEARPPPSPRQPGPQHEDGRRVADAHEDTGDENDDQERRP